MKRMFFLLLIVALICIPAFSQLAGSTLYVAVKTADLKSSAGVFADSVGVLKLGDTVTLSRINGKWAEVRTQDSLFGWTAVSSLSSRRITGAVNPIIASEVSLAGKGFNEKTELEFKNNGLDYSFVDTMETITIPDSDLQGFIEAGNLTAGIQNTTVFFQNVNVPFYETQESPTPQDEYYLGRAVAANILAIYKPYTNNTELSLYLNRICQTLVINSSRPVIFNGYHVMILDSPEYNAFATPGGHIFVTRGMIEAAPSEDALAGIIAHELAHIILRHSMSIIDDMKLERELASMAQYAIDSIRNKNAEYQRILAFRNSVSEFFDIMVKSGYSKPQEFEADNTATALLVASGYDPRGLLEMLQILQRFQRNNRSGFFSTHPSPAERITNAEQAVLLYRVNNTRSWRVNRFINN